MERPTIEQLREMSEDEIEKIGSDANAEYCAILANKADRTTETVRRYNDLLKLDMDCDAVLLEMEIGKPPRPYSMYDI